MWINPHYWRDPAWLGEIPPGWELEWVEDDD
jgi:hypothetical protein